VKVQCAMFRSSFKSWNDLVEEAREFASTIPREQLISISVSADSGAGIVFVWYWSDYEHKRPS
jgi:hypothetical protein